MTEICNYHQIHDKRITMWIIIFLSNKFVWKIDDDLSAIYRLFLELERYQQKYFRQFVKLKR